MCQYSYSADLLAGIGEILGSGQRVLTTEDLMKSLAEHQVGIEEHQ
jgi:aspartyl/asparaginyl-tRNA synthetase